MKALCLTLALLLPTAAFAQTSTYTGDKCAADDNECLLRALLFQTKALEQERLAAEHLQAALDAKTSEADALQAALSKEQRDEALYGTRRDMWVSVGVIGGIVLTTIIVYAVSHTTKQ